MAVRKRGMTDTEARLAEFAQGMDDGKLECKIAHRHVGLPPVTDPSQTKYTRRKNGVYQEVRTCRSCGSVVTKLIAPTGYLDEVVGNDYNHPEGYLNPPETRDVGAKESNAIFRAEGRRRNQERAKELSGKALTSPKQSGRTRSRAKSGEGKVTPIRFQAG